jgi:hypothetical protein
MLPQFSPFQSSLNNLFILKSNYHLIAKLLNLEPVDTELFSLFKKDGTQFQDLTDLV